MEEVQATLIAEGKLKLEEGAGDNGAGDNGGGDGGGAGARFP